MNRVHLPLLRGCNPPLPAVLSTLLVAACAAPGERGESIDGEVPEVIALSANALSVGEELRLAGDGFVPSKEGWVDVTFQGEFMPADGSPPEPVDRTVALQRDDETGEVVWRAFGNYRVPFGDEGKRHGTFEGRVFATNRYYDGRDIPQREGTRRNVRLEVEPSLVVRDFRAIGRDWVSDCRFPAPVALNKLPYALRVRAAGFEPERYEFHISPGLIQDDEVKEDVTVIEAPASGDEHALLAAFGPVPARTSGYQASINVYATARDGKTYQVLYPFTVRRPMEVYFSEPMRLAQLYEPEPVSSCIPGGPISMEVSYSESHSETRTRSVEHTLERGFERTTGQEHSETWGTSESTGGEEAQERTVTASNALTRGGSQTTTDTLSNTTGRSQTHSVNWSRSGSNSWNWNVGGESVAESYGEASRGSGWGANGKAGLPDWLADAEVGVKYESERGWMSGSRRANSSNWSRGGSTTSGWSRGGERSNTNYAETTRSRSQANERHWSRTQTYSEANSFSSARNWEETQSYEEAQTQSESFARSIGESETEIYTVSTTDAKSLETATSVLPENYGMWYRQTARLIRVGHVVTYDLCGNGIEVGKTQLTDWSWAAGLAQGSECPPEPTHPEADCYVEPCE